MGRLPGAGIRRADAFGHRKKANVGEDLSDEVKKATGEETIVSDLTYDLRSGSPDFVDKMVASTFAGMAMDCIEQGKHGVMMAISRRLLRRRCPFPIPSSGRARWKSRRCITRALPAQLRQQDGSADLPDAGLRRSPCIPQAGRVPARPLFSALEQYTCRSFKIVHSMHLQEVVEAEGHLIDSHLMEQIFDKVVEYNGRFEVEEFRIGRTNSDASYLRLRVETPAAEQMHRLLADCSAWAAPRWIPATRNCGKWSATAARPRISTPPPTTGPSCDTARVDRGGESAHGRDDRRSRDGHASCRRLRDLKTGDRVVVGMRGIRVVPESKERDRLAFAFMSNGISSERQVETAVRQTAALMQQTRAEGKKIVVVAGPVVVHTGGVRAAGGADPRADG